MKNPKVSKNAEQWIIFYQIKKLIHADQQHYLTLFKNVGEKLGFNIEILSGFTKHFGFELHKFPETFEINHSYNAVTIGKNILFCDICLAIILHEYNKTYNPFFFCLPYEIMIEFNFPFDTKWQEEGKIITFGSFRNRLRLYPYILNQVLILN